MKNLHLVLLFLLTSNFNLFAQGDCMVEVGTLPNETQFICVESSIPLESEGVVLGEQDALMYLVHTTSNFTESTIIDTILTDSLAWSRHENELIDFNTEYFVSAVAGLDEGGDGVPDDLMHECTVVSESMPVVWAADIAFDYEMDCYDSWYFDGMLCDFRGMEGVLNGQISNIGGNIGNLKRTFTITTDAGNFEIESEGAFFVFVGDEAIANYFFEINIQDNWSCLDTTFNADEVGFCHPSGWADIQTLTGMPIEQQIICPNDTTDIEAGCTYRLGLFGPPPIDYAILPTPEYDENAVIAVSEDRGLFTHQDVEDFWNTEVYVFATTLARPLFSPDLQLFVSNYPTPVVFLSPFDIDLQIEDCGANMAQITLSPIGGYPSYHQNNEDKYFISGEVFEGELTLGETTMIEWASSPIEMDSLLSFQVSDSYGCMQSIEVENPCLVAPIICEIEMGTLPNEIQYICIKSSIPLENEGTVLGEQDALMYLVHTTSNLIESTIIDTILTDSLEWSRHENELIDFNTEYFVSAVAGLDENTDGVPDDLMHECTVVSESMPVVWAAEVDFDTNIDCYVDLNTGGGLIDSLCARAIYSSTGITISTEQGNYMPTFNVSSENLQTEIQLGSVYLGEYFADIQPFINVQVQDDFGCVDTTLTIWVDECLDVEWTSDDPPAYVSGMPEETAIICEGDKTAIEAECVIRTFDYPLKYALSTTPNYSDGNFLATINSGESFTSEDAVGYLNTELYIFAFIPDAFFTIVSPSPTPIVFLSPFDIDLQIEDCGANMAQITLSPIGGYPSYHQGDEDKYFISGEVFEGELTLGETTMIEWASPPMEMDSLLSFQVSDSYGCMQSIEVENPCLSVDIASLNLTSFDLKTVYPIPAKDKLYLQIHSQTTQNLELQLVDIGGRQLLIQNEALQLGENYLQWEIGGMTAGMYYLQLTTTEGSLFKKIVLE